MTSIFDIQFTKKRKLPSTKLELTSNLDKYVSADNIWEATELAKVLLNDLITTKPGTNYEVTRISKSCDLEPVDKT